MRRPIVLSLLLVLVVVVAGCNRGDADADRRRSVVASIYPLEFIARNIAGDLADVTGLTPGRVQPHGLLLTAGQRRSINEADLFVYLGQGFQPAVDEMVVEMHNTLDVMALERPLSRPGDPHVWLDPVGMVRIAEAVVEALVEVDPENADAYEENAEVLAENLYALDDSFQNGLPLCARRQFVTSHEAFGYLADRFNLQQIGIAGIDPGEQASVRRLDELTRLVRQQGITTVFTEPLLAEGPAETVAEQIGATTAVLDPLESEPPLGDYVSVMQSNLRALRTALECR